jgi:cellulose synthase/poly-beta-1,6-N-acetylglucosamine synthase-like glycosyltransferase
MWHDTEMKLGVVIPTLNCAHLMESHVDSMLPWLDRADEIVVVDSNSTDGTLEILSKRISHPNVQIHQRPKGLYQAWNFGISQVRSKYTYVSTVGDSITPYGVDHLLDVAESLNADVVISKPDFINEAGIPIKGPFFPVDKIISMLRITEPARVGTLTCLLFQILTIPGAILGSSASNLYRTDLFQKHPFPTQFGTTGDGAWGIANVFHYALAVTPERFTIFREHEKAYQKKDYAVSDLNEKLLDLMKLTVKNELKENPSFRSRYEECGIDEMLTLVTNWLGIQRNLEIVRNQALPWSLNPRAWILRSQRSRCQKRLHDLINTVFQSEGHCNIGVKDIYFNI